MLSPHALGKFTIGADVIALAEKAQTITTRTTAQGSLQDASKRANVGGVDVVGVGRFVAAGDLGIVATLGLSLAKGVLVAHRELNTVVASGGHTFAWLGKGHGSSSKEDGRGEELHFDGLIWCATGESSRESFEKRSKTVGFAEWSE